MYLMFSCSYKIIICYQLWYNHFHLAEERKLIWLKVLLLLLCSAVVGLATSQTWTVICEKRFESEMFHLEREHDYSELCDCEFTEMRAEKSGGKNWSSWWVWDSDCLSSYTCIHLSLSYLGNVLKASGKSLLEKHSWIWSQEVTSLCI